jgi:hypothetical protein
VIVSLDSSANVRWAVRVPRRGNGMTDSSAFGETLAAVGDVDGDGISDLAVADSIDADGGEFRGAVWLCFLARDGSVRARTKISNWLGGFTGLTRDGERLGRSLAGAGDIDGDGTPDLLVGSATGVWTLFLRADGTVKGHRKLTNVPSDDGAAVGLSLAARRDQEDRVEVVSGGHLGSPTSPERVLWRLALTHDGVLQAR